MTDIESFKISEKTLQKILEKRDEMGYANKSWDEWFKRVLGYADDEESTKEIIEKIFMKRSYNVYYDNWIKNFANNLNNIWNEPSARELYPKSENGKKKASIVIGRGPSLAKNKHLEILKNSNFDGNIVCTDGVLSTVLESGITPENFENFFVVTIDSQDIQKQYYEKDIVKKYGKNIKCILSTTVSPTTYTEVKNSGMDIFWLHALIDHNKGVSSFNYISGAITKSKNHEKGLPAIQTGGNVGTSSWVISWSILKSNLVCLIGIDMGYPGDVKLEDIGYHKIPKDIDQNSEECKKAYPIIYNPEFKCNCRQDPVFLYYSNALKEFIAKTSSKIKTINATEGGALFGKGIHCMKFKNFLKETKM